MRVLGRYQMRSEDVDAQQLRVTGQIELAPPEPMRKYPPDSDGERKKEDGELD
jgi:hypothetical protein